jgi:hypothetical protein
MVLGPWNLGTEIEYGESLYESGLSTEKHYWYSRLYIRYIAVCW